MNSQLFGIGHRRLGGPNISRTGWACLIWLIAWGTIRQADAQQAELPPAGAWEQLRLLFVPAAELPAVLAGDTPRLVMERDQVVELLAQLRQLDLTEREASITDFRLLGPDAFIWERSHYQLELDGTLGHLRGSATGEAVGKGVFSLTLPWQQGLLRKLNQNRLNEKQGNEHEPSPIWYRTDGGEVALLLTQAGSYTFDVEMTLPVTTDLIRQVVPLHLPPAAITTLEVRVPGNVDLVSGASVLERSYDRSQDLTVFQLAVAFASGELVFTLNNRQSQQTLVWDSRHLIVAEVSRVLDRFQIVIENQVRQGQLNQAIWSIPPDLEVSQLVGEGVRQWQVVGTDQGPTLQVWFHPGQASKPFRLTAFRQRALGSLGLWEAPQIAASSAVRQPRIVQVATTDDILVPQIELTKMDLVPAELAAALVPTSADGRTLPLVPLGAWYGTDVDSRLQLTLEAAQDRYTAIGSHYLLVSQLGIESRSVFQVENQGELRFDLQLNFAPGFQVRSVSDAQGVLPFETTLADDRVSARVNLRQGIGGVTRTLASETTASTEQTSGIVELVVVAEWLPEQWFAAWQSRPLTLRPAMVEGAEQASGVIAIGIGPEFGLRTVEAGAMLGLGREQLREANLDALEPKLAFDFNGTRGELRLEVERLRAEQVAQTVAYYQLEPTRTLVRGELLIDVRKAAEDVFRIQLPSNAPDSAVIRCRPPLAIRQQRAVVDRSGLKEVQLNQPIDGRVHFYLDYDLPADAQAQATVRLEPLRLVGAVWQANLVSAESSPRVEATISGNAPKWGVDQLPETLYQPARRLIGVWDVSDLADGAVTADLELQQIEVLPAAAVQSRELFSQVSRDGSVITGAKYQIKATAGILWLELPPKAVLWSLTQDGVPQNVQHSGDYLIVRLPDRTGSRPHEIHFIYQQTGGFDLDSHQVSLAAPTWRLPQGVGEASEVPVLKTQWNLTPPPGLHLRWSPEDWSVRDARPSSTWLSRNWQWLQRQLGATVLGRARSVDAAAVTWERETNRELTLRGGMEVPDTVVGADAMSVALEQMQRRMVDRPAPGVDLPPRDLAKSAQPGDDSPVNFGMMSDGAGGRSFQEIVPDPGEGRLTQANQPSPSAFVPMAPAASPPPQKPSLGLQGYRSLPITTDRFPDEVAFFGLGDKPRLNVALIDPVWTDQMTWAIGLFSLAIGLVCSCWSWRLWLTWAAGLLLLSAGAQWLHDRLPEVASVLERLFWVVVVLVLWHGLVTLGRGLRRFRHSLSPATSAARRSGTVAGLGMAWFAMGGWDEALSTCLAQEPPAAAVTPLSLPEQAIVVTYDPERPAERLSGKWLVPKPWFDRVRQAQDAAGLGRPRFPHEILLPGGEFEITPQGSQSLNVVGTFRLSLPGPGPTYIPLPLETGGLLTATLDDVPVSIVDQLPSRPNRAVAPVEGKWLVLTGQGPHILKLHLRYSLTRVPGGWQAEGQLPVSTAADISVGQLAEGSRLIWTSQQVSRAMTIPDNGRASGLGVGRDGRFVVRWRAAEGQVRVNSASIRHDAIVALRESGVHVVSQFRVTAIEATDELIVAMPPDVQVQQVQGENLRGWNLVEGRPEQIVLQFLSSSTSQDFLLVLSGDATLWSPSPEVVEVPFPRVQGDGQLDGQVHVLRSQSLQVATTSADGLRRRDAAGTAQPSIWLTWWREFFSLQAYQGYDWQAPTARLQIQVSRPAVQVKVAHRSVLHFDVAKTMFETQISVESVNGPLNRIRLQLPQALEPLSLSCLAGRGPDLKAVAYQVAKRRGRDELVDEYELRFADYHSGPLQLNILGKLDTALEQPLAWQPIQILDASQQEYEYALTRNETVELTLNSVSGAERVLPDEFKGWLEPERVARLPLSLRARSAQHALSVSSRRATPIVTFESITDLTVGDRLVEETLLLEWTIERSGINQVEFLLPKTWRDCQIEGPWIGRVQRQMVDDDQVRFTVFLQDRIVGDYRLVATLDLPTDATQRRASVPQNLTGETRQRWITAQNSGQLEVEFLPQQDVTQVPRQRAIFADLQRKIQAVFLTNAFSVETQAAQPVLAWRSVPRSVIETRSARIRLTETDLMLDRQGWYVARQKLQISNRTQPKLQLQLPNAGRLVGLLVDGQPVQPLANPGGLANIVVIPLLKSTELNLDYPIELTYAGQIPSSGLWQETGMPLAVTVDVESEVSHVRLHLPAEMQPWYFGGTMSQVTSAGELLAEVQDYQTRLLADFKSSITSSKLSLAQQMRRKKEFDGYLSRNRLEQESQQSAQLRGEIEALSKVLTGEKLAEVQVFSNRSNIRALVANQDNTVELKQEANYFNNFANPLAAQQQEVMLDQIQQRQSTQADKKNNEDQRMATNQLLSQTYAADEDLQARSGKIRSRQIIGGARQQAGQSGLLEQEGRADTTFPAGGEGRWPQAQQPGVAMGDARAKDAAGLAQPRISSGLTLDFTPSGTIYYFRVPRGKPELTVAWSTKEVESRFWSTLQLLGVAAVLFIATRCFRRRRQPSSQRVA